MKIKTSELPFGIKAVAANGCGSITSNLKDEGCLWEEDDTEIEKARAIGAADAIESLLLALACEGVDITTTQFANAITTMVEAFVAPFNQPD